MSTRSSPLRRVGRPTRWLALTLVVACGGDPVVEPEAPVATTITLSPTSASLDHLGQSVTIAATIRDQNDAIFVDAPTWVSEDEAVASVSTDGIARATGNGMATIVASLGPLTASATVTVQQVATGVAAASGDGQEGLAGAALGDPVVVVVSDRGGAPMEGVTVTFAPEGADHGAVSVATAASDANGEVSTMWTLADRFGPHRVTASIDGAAVTLTAIARSETPTPDLSVVGLTVERPDPSTLEGVVVRATVTNEGDAGTGVGPRVALMLGASEIASVDLGALGPAEEEEVQFPAGPFAAGAQVLTLVLDADDVITELNEENNEAQRNLQVRQQTTLTEASAPSGLSGTTDDELLFRIELPPGPPTTLTIELTGGTGDADLFIEGGTRPAARDDYDDCVSAGPTTVERCQLAGAAGTYHVLVHAFSTFSSTDMTVTLGGAVVPFDLELVFIHSGTPSQEAAFRAAADRWNEIIVADLPDFDFSTQPVEANECIDGQAAVSGVVDDLIIYVSIVPIDGAAGTLAQAGPCAVRGITLLPILGSMEFDEADLASLEAAGDMPSVVLHEMGHVLGIGTIWPGRGLLQLPSLPDNQGADTHFSGEYAIEAFNDAGGLLYGGAKVPVENMAGEGSGDSHWRESVLHAEVMTPFLNSLTANPLSEITVQSLRDLSYGVDVTHADDFEMTLPAIAAASAARERLIDLRGDTRDGPVVVVGPKGRLTRIRR